MRKQYLVLLFSLYSWSVYAVSNSESVPNCIRDRIRERIVRINRNCSGVLLDARTVITAGHCLLSQRGASHVTGALENTYFEYFDTETSQLRRYRGRITATSAIVRDPAISANGFDSAALRIDPPIPNVAPIPTDISNQAIGDTNLIQAGFGATSSDVNARIADQPGYTRIQIARRPTAPGSIHFDHPSGSTGRIQGGDSGSPIFRVRGCELSLVGNITSRMNADSIRRTLRLMDELRFRETLPQPQPITLLRPLNSRSAQ